MKEEENIATNNRILKKIVKEKYAFRQVFSWLAAILIVSAHVFIAFRAFNMGIIDKVLVEVAKEHAAAAIGIPLAGTAALFLALILRIISGQIQFKIFQIEFKGAASQFIIWGFSYLVIIFSIYLLWPLVN